MGKQWHMGKEKFDFVARRMKFLKISSSLPPLSAHNGFWGNKTFFPCQYLFTKMGKSSD